MPEVHAVKSGHAGSESGKWHLAEEEGGCVAAPAIPETEAYVEIIDTSWPNWKIEEELLDEGDELCEECFPFPPEE